MATLSLNGKWKIRWSTGQRGGTPYVVKHPDDREHMNEMQGRPRELPGAYDGRGWLDAAVPGDVHLDLIKLGLLDDPYIGVNIFKARWVEECVWHYRRTFDAPAAAAAGRAALIFKSLNLNAIIYLNGEEVGRHSNAFCACAVDVSGKLRETGNELLVRLESGLFDVCERPIREMRTATASMDLLLHKRLWLRIPQSHTEWDWSPRLLNVGIGSDVLLAYDEQVVIGQASVRQSLSEDLACGTLEGRLFPCAGGGKGRFRMKIEAGGKSAERRYSEVPKEGFCARLAVEDPELWYPAGCGRQALYAVVLTLYEGEREIYRFETATGFRRVEVRQPPHPEKGHYFILHVNRVPVFCKGSNLVPNDMITAAITPARYDALTDLALEANFNILRVWGGGLYEADPFYELCDRKGILVWQEFISACGPLPIGDAGFLESLKTEAVYNIRRLSAHPSLVVWCGNNEIPPYSNPLYMKIYPELLSREDPEKYYQPSSPYTPNELEFAPKDKIDWDWAGDQHPWSIGFLDKDHRKYRGMECRFPNEGGILGPVSLPTMLDCTDGKGDYSGTMSWEVHDNLEHFWKVGSSPDEDSAFWLKLRPSDMALEDYVFGGGFVQGEGLADFIDNFRRRAFDSASAIFWMYNDCWPCARSWTIVDYRLNRTPSFYHVKRGFAPLRAIPVQDGPGAVRIFGSNHTMEAFEGFLRYGAFTCGGAVLLDQTAKVRLSPNSACAAVRFEAETEDPDVIPFCVLLAKDGREISRSRLLNRRYYEYPLEVPEISVAKTDGGYTLLSENYVMGVCLDLNGERPLPDNLFDLFPHIPCTLALDSPPVILNTVNGLLAKYGVIPEKRSRHEQLLHR